jgi:NAD(P)-dependent dehydrogenase (short-subunit alcohol dehydrogenase family)
MTFLDLDGTSDESVAAVEGYSESLDHEVREHGVRVLRVQPGPSNTPFMRGGDDPAVVAKVIVAAATDPKPKSRYLAGSTAGRVAVLRRIVPARMFDKSKLNRMAG